MADVCDSGQIRILVRHRARGGALRVRIKQVQDRRVQKTQSLLREALGSLIREKAYDAISVKEILDRANVGRSTFYMHFRDKDELLLSAIRDILGVVHSTKPPAGATTYEGIIGFGLPIFEHIHQHRRMGEVRMGARGSAVLHEHLRKVLAELLTDAVGKRLQGGRKNTSAIPPDLLVQYVATTFIVVLNWWVESRSRLPPKEINDLFRALILPTLAATARHG